MFENYYSTNKRVIKVDNKVIGYIEGNSFRKRVKGSLHQLRNPKAWAISKEPFLEDILINTRTIVIEDIETGQDYTCPTEIFSENSFEICRGKFEPQLACPLRFFRTDDNRSCQLSLL